MNLETLLGCMQRPDAQTLQLKRSSIIIFLLNFRVKFFLEQAIFGPI